jgi:hypothetical protein
MAIAISGNQSWIANFTGRSVTELNILKRAADQNPA